MSRFRDAVATSLVEVIIGLSVVAIGIGISTFDERLAPIGGSALAVLGGTLVSWGFTKSYVGEAATSELRASLRSLVRRLGAISSQIKVATVQMQVGDIAAERGTALVVQSNDTLSWVMTDMEEMVGDYFEPELLRATAERVAELAGSGADVEGELESLRSQLAKARSHVQREYRDESINCPHCYTVFTWQIGTIPGDSAAPVCTNCGVAFNVHRGPDGSVFTRFPGKEQEAASANPIRIAV